MLGRKGSIITDKGALLLSREHKGGIIIVWGIRRSIITVWGLEGALSLFEGNEKITVTLSGHYY